MISILQLGTIDYATGLRLQQQLVDLRKQGRIGDVLLLLEHTPVITLGRNADASNVVASPEFLQRRGIQLFDCDRGGDVTFHGLGQIVGYPIFDLRGFALVGAGGAGNTHVGTAPPGRPLERSSTARKYLGAVDFVRRLEDVLIRTCADFAIATKRISGLTGVWTNAEEATGHVGTAALGCPAERGSTAAIEAARQRRGNDTRAGHDLSRANGESKNKVALAAENKQPEAKLAAIGVHVSRFVTSHGFALNVNTDLSYFNLIIPCGITNKPVTSMQRELGRSLDLNAVAESISRNLGIVFQTQILWLESLDALLCGAGAPARERLNSLP